MKTRARILVLGPLLGRHAGRAITQGEILAAALRRCGYRVHEASHVIQRLGRALHMFAAVSRFWAYDIVILQVYSGAAFYLEYMCVLIARMLGRKVVLTMHGGALPQFARRHVMSVRSMYAAAHVVTAPSRYLAEEMQCYCPVPIRLVRNILPVPEGDVPDRHPQQSDFPHILWMRAFQAIYGPDIALDVMERVIVREPEARMTMAGGDLGALHDIQHRARAAGLQEHVHFAGYLTMSDKMRYACEASVYLNTNRIDNTPVSVLEMMYYGVPVVTTDPGGIPYLLRDRENALLAPVDDVETLASRVLEVVSDPELAETLRRNGRVLAAEFLESRVIRDWEVLLEEL